MLAVGVFLLVFVYVKYIVLTSFHVLFSVFIFLFFFSCSLTNLWSTLVKLSQTSPTKGPVQSTG